MKLLVLIEIDKAFYRNFKINTEEDQEFPMTGTEPNAEDMAQFFIDDEIGDLSDRGITALDWSVVDDACSEIKEVGDLENG